MKKLFIFGALITGLGATQAWATPTVTPCPTAATELSTYLASGFSCQVGDKIFSNFTYDGTSSGDASAIGASSIMIETMGATTGTDPAQLASANIGLQFSAPWSVSSACVGGTIVGTNCVGGTWTGGAQDSLIGFVVTVVNGAGMAITDAAVAQTSSGASGAGSEASVTEGGCSGAPCTPGIWNTFTFITGGGGTKTADDTFFSATGSVQVSKDIDVTAGAVYAAAANISDVQDTFSQSPTGVPEPATMLLVGGVLCGIAVIRRRSVES
jgi:hypothetical protein